MAGLDIDTQDLVEWGSRLESRSEFPRLIATLVAASVPSNLLQRAYFPFAEDVNLRGWDGEVESSFDHRFVPRGTSRWELKTSKDSSRAANEDYRKRTRDPLGINPEECTYVAATIREWPEKRDWREAKQKDGVWKDVLAFDAIDLVAWLVSAPAARTWLARRLGMTTHGSMDLDSFWEDWSESTDPAIPPNVMLAGRGQLQKQVVEWVESGSGTLSIQADTREEALAFVAACLRADGDQNAEGGSARVFVTQSSDAWALCAQSEAEVILTSLDCTSESIARATRHNHRVISPLGQTDLATPGTLALPRLSRSEATEALEKIGLDHGRAWNFAGLVRRSLGAFRRMHSIGGPAKRPPWADTNQSHEYLPLILAGSWDGSNGDDRDVVSLLCELDYREIEQRANWLARQQDPPMRLTGSCWQAVSLADSYSLLRSGCTRELTQRFCKCARLVLTWQSPRFDIDKGKRWLAVTNSRDSDFSQELRNCIASTLALASARWSDEDNGPDWESQVRLTVGEVLAHANESWKHWATLSTCLTSLAEAAPSEFLHAIESSFGEDIHAAPLARLMSEEESHIFGIAPHVGVLHALEVLAWNPKFLTRSSLVLAKLASIDTGGFVGNRPAASLRGIFLPWHPNTTASNSERIGALKAVCNHAPGVAWRLLLSLLPKTFDSGEVATRPKWRNWDDRPVDTGDDQTGLEHLAAVIDLLTELAGVDGPKWGEFIDGIAGLPDDQISEICSAIEAKAGQIQARDGAAEVWHALRRLVSKHRSYSEAHWALPTQAVEQFAALMSAFEPVGLLENSAWLFDHRVALPEGNPRDHQTRETLIEEKRQEAIGLLVSNGDLATLMEVVAIAKVPAFLGSSLARSTEFEACNLEGELLVRNIDSESEPHARAAFAYTLAKHSIEGEPWVRKVLSGELSARLTDQQKALILCALPHTRRTFDQVDAQSPGIASAYWRLTAPGRIESDNDLKYFIEKLIQADRPVAACEALVRSNYHRESPVSGEVVSLALEALVSNGPESPPDSHDVEILLSIVANDSNVQKSTSVRLEWALGSSSRGNSQQVLLSELNCNCSLFVEAMSIVHSASESDFESTAGFSRWQRARDLLASIARVPASASDGTFSKEELRHWIDEARTQLAERELSDTGDFEIGKILSHAPQGDDSAWPHEHVRELLEELDSNSIDEGFIFGRQQARGVTTRRANAGGAQERSLAESYRGMAKIVRRGPWPRAATALEKIAELYVQEAVVHDNRSNLREDAE